MLLFHIKCTCHLHVTVNPWWLRCLPQNWVVVCTIIPFLPSLKGGHEWNHGFVIHMKLKSSWLRYGATSREVAGSVADVTRIFHWHNPSGRTVALGSTQPLTEMSTRNISWRVKAARCIGLTTLPPSCADCLEIWEPQYPGTLRACPGLYRDCFTFYI